MNKGLLFFERLIMRKLTLSVILVLLFSLMLFACTSNRASLPGASPEIVQTGTSPSSVETTYPIAENPETYIGTLYPLGQSPTDIPATQVVGTIEPSIVPDYDPGKASVYGVLLSYTDKQPLQGVMVYAADVVIVETSGDKIYTTQEKSSPHDASDNIGQFTITQIKPGSYLFMMVTPFGNYPVFDGQNFQLELELKAGDVIDFGEVYVNWP